MFLATSHHELHARCKKTNVSCTKSSGSLICGVARKVVDAILVHLVAKIAARYRLYRLFVHEAACTFLTRPCLFPPFDQGQPHETTWVMWAVHANCHQPGLIFNPRLSSSSPSLSLSPPCSLHIIRLPLLFVPCLSRLPYCTQLRIRILIRDKKILNIFKTYSVISDSFFFH